MSLDTMTQAVWSSPNSFPSNPLEFAQPYCLPSHPCYPGLDAFAQLNDTLSGKLIKPREDLLASVANCSEARCADAAWRASEPGVSSQYTNFVTGWGALNASTDVPTNESHGRVADYVVAVESAEDVATAVNFAREHRLRLRIRNTGHDYLGRSSDPDTFVIWTHHLKSTEHDTSFTPIGAPLDFVPQAVLRAGAGVQVKDLYAAADAANVIVPGGVSATVGAAGGFVLGGGHGPFAPLLGLAADNVLEFTVVTSNGTILRTSPFAHPTLFTALRGGGHGSFAVVVEVVFAAAPAPDGFVGIFGTFDLAQGVPDGSPAWTRVMQEWMRLQPNLSDAGPFAGYSYIRQPQFVPFAYILPSADLELAKRSFAPFIAHVEADPEINLQITFAEEKSWYKMWSGPFDAALVDLDSVGINILLGSRLVPRTVVENDAEALGEYLALSASPAIVHLVAGNAVTKTPLYPSSVNPAWRTTLLHIDLPVSWPNGSPQSTISAMEAYLTRHTKALGRIASANGTFAEASYVSESDYNEEGWQEIWYGNETYKSLLAAKVEWDPQAVFSGRRVVGSEISGY